MALPSIALLKKYFKENILFVCLLYVVSIAVYLNSLGGSFAVVDDLQGYIENPNVRDLVGSIKSLELYKIWYAIVFHFFGINPLPMRIMAVITHGLMSILAYVVISLLFGKKIGRVSALLFAVHPVNSESISWISAHFYIIMTLFSYLTILAYILYRKTQKQIYLYFLGTIFLLYMIFFRHPWVIVTPMVILIIDFFILKRGFDMKFYKKFMLIFVPIIIVYLIAMFPQAYKNRTDGENIQNGKVLVNEQALIPIIEGYPYSLYSITRLYLFPMDLSVYYDGNRVGAGTKISMYIILILYVTALIYFYSRDKRITGILLLMIVFVAPVFSPIKITWYITERYLYFGTAFFTALIAITIFYIEKKTKISHLAYILVSIVFILFATRTIIRNRDWKNPETLARATMKTAPLSVRPYNDLAGHYVRSNRVEEAKQYYSKAIRMGASIVAMNNLGYLYLLGDVDPTIHTIDQPIEELLTAGFVALQQKEARLAMYYFNEAYGINQKDTRTLNAISLVYIETSKFAQGKKYLSQSLEQQEDNPETYFLLGYLAFKEGNISEAEKYLTTALTLNQNHEAAKSNLEYIRNTQKK